MKQKSLKKLLSNWVNQENCKSLQKVKIPKYFPCRKIDKLYTLVAQVKIKRLRHVASFFEFLCFSSLLPCTSHVPVLDKGALTILCTVHGEHFCVLFLQKGTTCLEKQKSKIQNRSSCSSSTPFSRFVWASVQSIILHVCLDYSSNKSQGQ